MKLKILLVLLLIGGSGAYAYQEGIINKPSYGMIDRGDWGTVNQSGAEINTEIWINNDNPTGIELENIEASYKLALNREIVAKGKRNGINLQKGNQTKTISTRVNTEELEDWWISHLRRDETSDLRVEGDLKGRLGPLPINIDGLTYSDSLNTDIEGMMDRSVEGMRENYSYDAVFISPEIQVRGGSARFGEVTSATTPIIFTINLHNPNNYPIPKPKTAGSLTMNGIKLAEWNEKTETSDTEKQVIEPGETKAIQFRADMENQKIGDWMISHIEKNERSQGEINLNMIFEVQGFRFKLPGGDGMSCRFDIQTAMLEDGQKQSTDFKGCTLPNENLRTKSINEDAQKEGSNKSNQDGSSSQIGELLG